MSSRGCKFEQLIDAILKEKKHWEGRYSGRDRKVSGSCLYTYKDAPWPCTLGSLVKKEPSEKF